MATKKKYPGYNATSLFARLDPQVIAESVGEDGGIQFHTFCHCGEHIPELREVKDWHIGDNSSAPVSWALR
jgi:hypothetical protein